MKRLTVLYAGRVQGVGFRATVRQLACGYEVTGTVKNLPDGRVELIAEGREEELQAFQKGIAESELSSYIHTARENWGAAQGTVKGFTITH